MESTTYRKDKIVYNGHCVEKLHVKGVVAFSWMDMTAERTQVVEKTKIDVFGIGPSEGEQEFLLAKISFLRLISPGIWTPPSAAKPTQRVKQGQDGDEYVMSTLYTNEYCVETQYHEALQLPPGFVLSNAIYPEHQLFSNNWQDAYLFTICPLQTQFNIFFFSLGDLDSEDEQKKIQDEIQDRRTRCVILDHVVGYTVGTDDVLAKVEEMK